MALVTDHLQRLYNEDVCQVKESLPPGLIYYILLHYHLKCSISLWAVQEVLTTVLKAVNYIA